VHAEQIDSLLMLCSLLWQMWPQIAPGIRAFTKAAGFPMLVTLQNATVYTRLKGRPLALISTEPATAAGSVTIQGQEAESSSSRGLSGGAIAGVVVGSVAAVVLLAALAAFGFLRLRKRRQQKAADTKLNGAIVQHVPLYMPTDSSGSTSRLELLLSSCFPGAVLLTWAGCAAYGVQGLTFDKQSHVFIRQCQRSFIVGGVHCHLAF
jgi:hypothetical protein